uniref:CSON009818 protein n=1 Tax=Culicoides sonorensis TaxID=179676 RepID=A0A336LF11_CULSO
MQQPKTVIRPTNLVQISLQTHTNYGFDPSLYSVESNYNENQMTSSNKNENPIQLDNSKIEYQSPPPSYLQANPQSSFESSGQRQVLQSQVVIVQSGRQIQTGYPIQSQNSDQPSMESKITTIQSQSTIQRPPVIVQPGGEILNPTLRQVLRHKSSLVLCPQCHEQIMTKVEYEANTTTHCLAFILCIFLCWCCCCIPYCVKGSRNAHHHCPKCGVFLGTHEVELC